MSECVCVCVCVYFFFLIYFLDLMLDLICHSWKISFLTGLRSSQYSLHLLVICYCHFSLASFILLAKSLAYSAASSLFFLVHCFFRAIGQHLCCWICGVTRHWILGALVVGFLPSLFKGFLTIYWWTSSLERRESILIWTLG